MLAKMLKVLHVNFKITSVLSYSILILGKDVQNMYLKQVVNLIIVNGKVKSASH